MAEERSAVNAPGSPEALGKLDGAITRLLEELEEARERAAELAQIGDGVGDTSDPRELAGRVRKLETENEDLRDRLASGHEIAQRLMAKIRFLEEKK